MDCYLKAEFDEFPLGSTNPHDASVIIPTVSGPKNSRLGTHAYYFLNFKTQKGLCVRISHWDIISLGIREFADANQHYHFFRYGSLLFKKYHYGFNLLEQIMLMTVPHTVTEEGSGRFIINLWAYPAYLIIDLRKKTVSYKKADEGYVFGSKRWVVPESDDHYYMTYSLKDSLKKAVDPMEAVFSNILKRDGKTGGTTTVWKGYFSDYMHDILVNRDGTYLVVCELGRFSDRNGGLIPSKVLTLDLKGNKEWIIDSVANAAHAQFDPDDSEIIYFSNHNFQFEHTKFRDLLKKGTYTLKFFGPASVHKYQITSEGPREVGVFTEPDLFRLTNFHVFVHRGQKILAAMGAPNFIYLADPVQMKLIGQIEVNNPDVPAYIGTFTPSFDGEKLYIQTTRSFQVLDLSSGRPDFIQSYEINHTCSNHSLTSRDIDW